MPSANRTDTIDAFLEDRHRELAAEAAAFAAEHLVPLPAPEDDDTARTQARRILEILGREGWCRWAVPAAYGGAAEEIDLRSCCLIREALASVSPLADAVFALQCLGSMPIALAGSEELKAEWLPKVASGEAMAAFAMTEAEAGSDVKGIATRARPDGAGGGGYRLSGRKMFISNAGIADFYTTFAVVKGGEPEAAGELSCFVVPADAEGLRFAAPQILSEPHPLGEMAYEDCKVGASALLGAVGDGFHLGMRTLDRLRATVAAASCGIAARALDEAVSRAAQRVQFGRPLSKFQLVQAKLATMATELDAARLLTYRAAWEASEGDGSQLTRRSAEAKLYATEAAQRIVDQAVQIHGGGGVLADATVDRLYRAIRALRIYEGTSEIQQLVIARELLRGDSQVG